MKASKSASVPDLKSGVTTIEQLRMTGDAFTNVTQVLHMHPLCRYYALWEPLLSITDYCSVDKLKMIWEEMAEYDDSCFLLLVCSEGYSFGGTFCANLIEFTGLSVSSYSSSSKSPPTPHSLSPSLTLTLTWTTTLPLPAVHRWESDQQSEQYCQSP